MVLEKVDSPVVGLMQARNKFTHAYLVFDQYQVILTDGYIALYIYQLFVAAIGTSSIRILPNLKKVIGVSTGLVNVHCAVEGRNRIHNVYKHITMGEVGSYFQIRPSRRQ